MRQSVLAAKCFLGLALVLAPGGAPAAEADDFTLGLKAWSASLSANNLDGDSDLFPGVYFAWDLTDRLWISAGYVAGEVDFTLTGSTTSGSIEEVDSDLIVGWSFPKLDVGVGYRLAEFTTITNDGRFPVTSTGPMVYLGGGDLFGQYRWGYYWGVAYMFKDMDDDDGSQKHINAEAGIRWTSQKNLSILFGYRHKEYSGEGSDFSFSGPVVNLAYTWR